VLAVERRVVRALGSREEIEAIGAIGAGHDLEARRDRERPDDREALP
jgi:hypothetical protein